MTYLQWFGLYQVYMFILLFISFSLYFWIYNRVSVSLSRSLPHALSPYISIFGWNGIKGTDLDKQHNF